MRDNKKKIIALTGGIGSGKTTVANIFFEIGVPYIDTDDISKEMIKPNTKFFKSIKNHFGPSILHKNGEINRMVLRNHIFNSKKEKKWCENLLHPHIIKESIRRINFLNYPYVLWIVPLLIEKKLYNIADLILVVDSNKKNQIKRIMKRDYVSKKEVEKIILNQTSRLKRLSYANHIIKNNKEIKKLFVKVKKLHNFYLKYSLKS